MIKDKIIPQDLKDTIRILVAEDNVLNKELISYMLTDLGLKHDVCGDGKQALENIKSTKYDLILMDLHMPELDGFEAAEHIRKTLKLDLPIIAMTALSLPEEKEKCLSIGITEVISKPVNEAELFNLIVTYLFPDTSKKEITETNNSFDSESVTNLDFLVELSKGNTGFVKEMISTFLTENIKEIGSLEEAIRSKNFEAIKQAAHLMQSSIPFVGLDKIIESEVREIEKLAARRSDIHRIEQLFTKVKKACEKACVELKATSI